MKKCPVAGVVLAAGMSTRMGRSKLIMELEGKPLIVRVVEAALRSELAQVFLVLGHEADLVIHALVNLVRDERLTVLLNERYREGMSTSLQAGLLPVKDRYPAVMFLLGDQPLAGADLINLLLQRFQESDKDICQPLCGARPGNPVCFSSRFYDDILAVRGDKGARDIVGSHPEDVLYVEIDNPLCFIDIDTPEDAEKFPHLSSR